MNMLIPGTPQPALPLHGTFSGHETFTFRYGWLKKGVDGILARSDIFSRDDAMVELGVGKNMVRSMRHWCLATRVLEEVAAYAGSRTRNVSLSDIGRSLFVNPGWDPYLEDDGSLWLLHWLLATNSLRATTWYWAFNLLKEQEFTRVSVTQHLERLVENKNWGKVAQSSLEKDVSCFLRTYVPGKRGPNSTPEETLDCPLAELGLLVETGETNRYRFNNGPKPGLPNAVFCYALIDCWNQRHANQETLSLREIVHGEGSPGRVFRLDDDTVMDYLDRVSDLTSGKILFNDSIMARQVVKKGNVNRLEILDAYYNR